MCYRLHAPLEDVDQDDNDHNDDEDEDDDAVDIGDGPSSWPFTECRSCWPENRRCEPADLHSRRYCVSWRSCTGRANVRMLPHPKLRSRKERNSISWIIYNEPRSSAHCKRLVRISIQVCILWIYQRYRDASASHEWMKQTYRPDERVRHNRRRRREVGEWPGPVLRSIRLWWRGWLPLQRRSRPARWCGRCPLPQSTCRPRRRLVESRTCRRRTIAGLEHRPGSSSRKAIESITGVKGGAAATKYKKKQKTGQKKFSISFWRHYSIPPSSPFGAWHNSICWRENNNPIIRIRIQQSHFR